MLKKILIFLVIVSTVCFSFNVQAQDAGMAASKRELILKFIDITGTRKSLEDNFREILSRTPPQRKDQIQKILDVDAVIEELIPLYDKHFEENDLRAAINFYESTVGKKILTALPEIMKESAEVSSRYFQKKMTVSVTGKQ